MGLLGFHLDTNSGLTRPGLSNLTPLGLFTRLRRQIRFAITDLQLAIFTFTRVLLILANLLFDLVSVRIDVGPHQRIRAMIWMRVSRGWTAIKLDCTVAGAKIRSG